MNPPNYVPHRRFLALLVPVIGFGIALSATAAIFTVNTTSDAVVVGACQNGLANCSLRGAIQAANSHPGADGIEIVLPAGSVINLTGALPNLTESVGILGPGANLVTVRRSTGGSYRIFLVTTTGLVAFTGLTISNGLGGISNVDAATVTVRDCTLSGNVTASGLGGGIYNNSTGTVNVIDSTFSGNSASSGGAIYNNSTGFVKVTDSTFSDNTASSGSNGGGISTNNGGTLEVTNSTFTGNFAAEGGGIAANSTATVTNCVFQGNGAINGGGIYNDGGTLNITNCTFTGNGADGDGGGIANDKYGTANVSNSTFNANFANNGDSDASGGGAICNGDHNHGFGGHLTVTNTTITGNIAVVGCGISTAGAAVSGSLTVTNSTIVGNSLFFGGRGGGIASDGEGPPVNIKNTIVALNTAADGHDVYGPFASSGFNLIGKTDGSTGFTQVTDQVGTIASPLDPKLDPQGLQNNGGPTQTIALQPGSPALDKGTSNGLTGSLTTDQRGTGFPRAANYSNVANAAGGDGTDIGAFEGTRLQITSITRLGSGAIRLQGIGCPNAVHTIEASVIPDSSGFGFLGNATSDGTGALLYDDATGLTKRFYRLQFP